jgi:4,5-DOPA dioxygenase extradiol
MMPALFVGHGSPMNALGGNAFAEWLTSLGRELPRPRAILSVSAHWETSGTQVLDVAQPSTIHDFYGFPPELYAIRYPATGSVELTDKVVECLGSEVQRSSDWGLDHGTWSVLCHLYPKADVPVVQLSLDTKLDLAGHYRLAAKLKALRKAGFLILGSGNVVHNLRKISFVTSAPAEPWAVAFDQFIEHAIVRRDTEALVNFTGSPVDLQRLALPSLEHYIPLLYVMATAEADEAVSFPFGGIQNGSISMRSVRVG